MWSTWARALDLRDRHCGKELGQHLGPPEDHPERILQVMRNGAKNLALERVGAPQPCALALEPLLGRNQFRRPPLNLLFQLQIGALQLLVERHVVESRGQTAAEHFHKRLIGVGKLLLGLKEHDQFAAAAGADIKDVPPAREVVASILEGRGDQRVNVRV
jgi:hypothetical protein